MKTARTWTLLVWIWLRDRGVDKATHLISVGLACDKLLSKQQVLPSGSPFKVSLITTCECLCIGGACPSSSLFSAYGYKKDNNDEFVRHHSSCSVYSGRASKLIQAEGPIEILWSHSRIILLFKDQMSGKWHKRWGTHGVALCGLSTRGDEEGQIIPWGQFHSNNEVFKALFVTATGNFDRLPLPPSVGRRYYDPNWRTAAVAACQTDCFRATTVLMLLTAKMSESEQNSNRVVGTWPKCQTQDVFWSIPEVFTRWVMYFCFITNLEVGQKGKKQIKWVIWIWGGTCLTVND